MSKGILGSEGSQLLTRPAALTDLRSLSPPTLLAMAVSALVVMLDGAAGPGFNLVPLLAIAPVIAAMSASEPETGVVGAFCVVMALLSGLWNDDFAEGDHVVAILVVGAGSAVGLWIAAMRERLERGRNAEALLAEAGALLEDELEQGKRAEHLAKIAVPALADSASVDLLQPDGTIQRASSASTTRNGKGRKGTRIDPSGSHPVARAVASGEERVLDDGDTLVVPLRARGSTVGAMTLSLEGSERAYDHDARRVVSALAERCALALDNARVHQEQAHIASVLQRSLMPVSLPEVDGFETAWRFLAAGEANRVGGDFFDLFRSGKETWTAVIGDVCGKGPEAASLTALARHTIRASETPELPPSEVLSSLHESIKQEDTGDRFCTAALARVERTNGRARARITLGGHPAPLAVRANGKVKAVGEPGTLLGVLEELRLRDASTPIRSGDSLVLFTDGLLEARDRSGQSDEAWPVRVLKGANGHSAEWIADKLLEKALERQGGEPRDDIAIVVLRRSP